MSQYDTPVFSDIQVVVSWGTTQGKVADYKKSLQWDQNIHPLTGALYNVSATQSYLSGAKLEMLVNGNVVGTLHWFAFESGTKTTTVDISGSLKNGDNTFSLQYSTAAGVFTDQICTVSATLTMSFGGIEDGKNPLNVSDTTRGNFWQRFMDNLKTILIISIVIVAIVVILYLVVVKRNSFSGIVNGIKRFRVPFI